MTLKIIPTRNSLAKINVIRRQNNLKVFVDNDKLYQAACNHLNWMVVNNKLSHDEGWFGPNLSKRLKNVGFKYSNCAENIGYGQDTIEDILSDWMSSSGHKRNLLGDYEFCSFVHALDKKNRTWWICVFGSGE